MPVITRGVQGRLDLVLGEAKAGARPESRIHLPARLPHTVRATEPSVMPLTMLPAPEPS